ncbi:MAG: sarcosine oxidase subunit gamma [Rhodobacteraceae bacterium]|nr:sarcosine oxidase subunit gamma [Paracoccaceae bacterium]
MAEPLPPRTPFGLAEPLRRRIGPVGIVERFDLALVSLAERQGKAEAFATAARAAGIPLPGPARRAEAPPFAAFWVAPGMWFVEAPLDTHPDPVAALKPVFGAAASLSEQTDAWVRLELAAGDLAPLLERLCNVDYATAPDGFATRTLIEHLGCYLIRLGPGAATLLGPRSSAESLLHAIETAAAAIA